MIIITIRELLMDFRNMLRGWRLILHLVLLGLLILVSCTGEDGLAGYMMAMYFMFSTVFVRPRINKLFYLLPTQMRDRCNYILIKHFGHFLYNSLLYLLAITISVLLTDYRFSQELPMMVSYVFPIFIAYGALMMGNGYHMGKTPDEEITKKYQKRYSASSIMAILTMVTSMLLSFSFIREWLPGMAEVIITIISYCFAFAGLCLQISVLKHTEISEENVRKYEKFFG